MNTKYAEWEKAYPEKSQRLESLEARIVKIQEEKARHEAKIASLKLQIKARDAALGAKADGSPLSGGSNKRRKTKRKLSRKRKLSKKRKSKKRKSKKKNKTRRHR